MDKRSQDTPDMTTTDMPVSQGGPIVALRDLSDTRGGLVSVESGKDMPFAIERVYFIYGTQPGVERGFHAHIALRQFAICVSGNCEIILDDGRQRRTYILDDPAKGLLITASTWREMRKFSSDAVLVVLADAHYDEADYIRNYDDFIAHVETSVVDSVS